LLAFATTTISIVYDLRDIAKDQSSERRTTSATDELYISTPYFTEAEAACIKATKVEFPDDLNVNLTKISTVEEAITSNLGNFFEKRKASGDYRPCGPHDMASVYQRVEEAVA
jgi:hypothetical protein